MARYDFTSLRVLIVDDNQHMRRLVMEILYSFGCKHVYEASDGADAFNELKSNPIDIVVVDWVMQPLDGLDFIKLARTAGDSPNPYVPIIMLTGHTEMRRVVEARDAGVTEFLAKPISAEGLFARLVSVIENPRPFVKSKNYVGPCRRRRDDPNYTGPERRRDYQKNE